MSQKKLSEKYKWRGESEGWAGVYHTFFFFFVKMPSTECGD